MRSSLILGGKSFPGRDERCDREERVKFEEVLKVRF